MTYCPNMIAPYTIRVPNCVQPHPSTTGGTGSGIRPPASAPSPPPGPPSSLRSLASSSAAFSAPYAPAPPAPWVRPSPRRPRVRSTGPGAAGTDVGGSHRTHRRSPEGKSSGGHPGSAGRRRRSGRGSDRRWSAGSGDL